MNEQMPDRPGNAGDGNEPVRSEIEAIIARYSARGVGEATPVPGLSVGRKTKPLPPTSLIHDPSLCLCIRGAKNMIVGERRFTHREDQFLLFSAESPVVVSIDNATESTPYTALQIYLDLEIAREVAADMDANRLGTSASTASWVEIATLTDELFDAVLRLVRLIERPNDIPIMRDVIQRELMFRLLSGSTGARFRQILRAGSPSHGIARAVSMLRNNFTKKLSVEELAEAAGMGVSTLHRHFLEITTMSPVQYQKHLRLHEARRLMLVDEVEASAAAFRVGYESATQFNREYRRMFGSPPVRDVKQLRSAV